MKPLSMLSVMFTQDCGSTEEDFSKFWTTIRQSDAFTLVLCFRNIAIEALLKLHRLKVCRQVFHVAKGHGILLIVWHIGTNY